VEVLVDVYCATCDEPYEMDYLLHELPHEIKLPLPFIKDIAQGGGKLNKIDREMFEKLGWEFGHNILVVVRCPSCGERKTNRERASEYDMLAFFMGDDLDGLASEMEDFHDMFGGEP
jgi:hypothetical protein